MARIILVRHGETDWNKQEIFRGRMDVNLNQNGIKQAEAIGEELKERKLDVVYSSPLSRAQLTAKIIADYHNLEVNVEQGFVDLNYGKWQGISHEDVKAQYPELYALWQKQPHLVKFPAGECLDDVRHRTINTLEKIISKHNSDTVAIVAHRVVNKVMLCAVLGLETSHFWLIRQDTCCINIFEDSLIGFDTLRTQPDGTQPKGYVLYCLNDTCHLKHLKKDIVTADF